jgi:hypothetical protein
VCEIVLFRIVIVLDLLVVGTYCTSVASVAPICTSSGVGVWAPQQC